MEKTNSKTDFLSQIQPHSAGIDVGAGFHFVAVSPSVCPESPVRSFATHTEGLEELAQWLVGLQIKTVALESTGVYWQPLYDMLEKYGLAVSVANARYVRNVPGRKTDVADSQWLQQLHSVGLLHASFVPEEKIRELRTYLRFRSQCVQEKGVCINRMDKALQQLNIKIRQVISKLDTQVGMGIIRAIAAGERNGQVLADKFYTKQMKASKEDLAKALQGHWKEEYVFTLTQALLGYDFHHQQLILSESKIEAILQAFTKPPSENNTSSEEKKEEKSEANSEEKIEKGSLAPSRQKTMKVRQNEYHFDVRSYLSELFGTDLCQITGLSENTILSIVGEVGTDLSRWKTAKHFVSWLGLAPMPKISGGKLIGSFRKRMSNQATEAFRMAAYSLHSAKGELGGLYRKMAAKKGSPIAIKTVARKLAIIFYQMVRTKTAFDPERQKKTAQKQEEKQLKWLQKQARMFGMNLTPISINN